MKQSQTLRNILLFQHQLWEIIPDERALAGFRARKKEQSINDLPSYTLGRDESIVVRFRRSFRRNFSIAIDSVGSPMDAPLYLRVKFAEIPAEIAVESSAYEGMAISLVDTRGVYSLGCFTGEIVTAATL